MGNLTRVKTDNPRLLRFFEAHFDDDSGDFLAEKQTPRDPIHLANLARNSLALDSLPTHLQGTPDAIRLIHRNADRLLVARRPGGKWSCLTVDPRSGTWVDDESALRSMHVQETTQRLVDFAAFADADAQTVTKVSSYMAKGRTRRHQDECISQLGVAVEIFKDSGQIPAGLTVCDLDDLDTDMRYLGTPAGALDLKTGQVLRPEFTRPLKITQRIPDDFDLDATHPDVDQLFGHLDDEIKQFVLQALGFALRGYPTRRLYFLLGKTKGGKTTLIQALKACLGPYVDAFNVQAIRQQTKGPGNAGLSPELRPFMRPARLAFSSDSVGPAEQLSTERIKSLSGGDPITWRSLNQDFRSETATATMVLIANILPQIGMSDGAVRDRVKILPWGLIPKDQIDVDLPERLQVDPECRQALLAMVVRSALDLGRGPPDEPTAVREAVEEQRLAEIGPVGMFIEDLLEEQPGGFLTTSQIWVAAKAEFGVVDGKEQLMVDGSPGPRRRRVTDLAKQIYDLPSLSQQTIDGKTVRGWRGWGFKVQDAPPDQQDLVDRFESDEIPF